jgi:hypothetical protein
MVFEYVNYWGEPLNEGCFLIRKSGH